MKVKGLLFLGSFNKFWELGSGAQVNSLIIGVQPNTHLTFQFLWKKRTEKVELLRDFPLNHVHQEEYDRTLSHTPRTSPGPEADCIHTQLGREPGHETSRSDLIRLEQNLPSRRCVFCPLKSVEKDKSFISWKTENFRMQNPAKCCLLVLNFNDLDKIHTICLAFGCVHNFVGDHF